MSEGILHGKSLSSLIWEGNLKIKDDEHLLNARHLARKKIIGGYYNTDAQLNPTDPNVALYCLALKALQFIRVSESRLTRKLITSQREEKNLSVQQRISHPFSSVASSFLSIV